MCRTKCLILLLCLQNVVANIDTNKFLQTLRDIKESNMSIVSEACTNALDLYINNLQTDGTDRWALSMFDANSKIPVGLLSYNFGELGQFSQCLATESADGSVKARYCLGTLPVDQSDNNTGQNSLIIDEKKAHLARQISRIINLQYLDSNENDNGNDASQFYQPGITWAICLPSDCSNQDMSEFWNTFIGVRTIQCQTKEDLTPPLTNGAIAAIVVLAIFALLLIVSTALDLYYKFTNKEIPHVILTAFSSYTNGKKLFQISENSNELTCLNGIRLLSMMWVIIGHVFTFINMSPVVNMKDIMKWSDALRSMTIASGTLSVDTFFVMSGVLLVYSYFKAKHYGVKFNIFKFYIHRYLRLTPALAAMVLVSAHLMKYMGNGPNWSTIYFMEETCQKYWWTTLLYVQNYVNENMAMCLPQTWYLSVDMQLYIISPLILIPLWRFTRVGIGLLVVEITTFIIIPFCIAYINDLPAFLITQDLQGLTNYTKYYYMKTHARAAPYFIGALLGYLLAKIKFNGLFRNLKFNKVVILLIWTVSLAVLLTCVYAGHSTLRGSDADLLAKSFYIALVRPVWALCLSWVIFACVTGYGGPVNWLMSFPIYQVLNRFTYSIYLIHYPLLSIFAYSLKTGVYFDEVDMAYSFWGITFFSLALSVIWVLAFESPVIAIEKLIFSSKKNVKNTTEGNGQRKTNSALA